MYVSYQFTVRNSDGIQHRLRRAERCKNRRINRENIPSKTIVTSMRAAPQRDLCRSNRVRACCLMQQAHSVLCADGDTNPFDGRVFTPTFQENRAGDMLGFVHKLCQTRVKGVGWTQSKCTCVHRSKSP